MLDQATTTVSLRLLGLRLYAFNIQVRQYRSRVILEPVNAPPHRRQEDHADQNDAVVVHQRGGDRESVCCEAN